MKIPNKKLYFLNLPPPPQEIISHMYNVKDTLDKEYPDGRPPILEKGARWTEEFYNHQRKSVIMSYNNGFTNFTEQLNLQINNLYSPYFNCEVLGLFGLFKNRYPGHSYSTSIHSDKNRNCAFNYIIETGGTNVKTNFYDKIREPHPIDHKESINYKIDEVKLEFSVILLANRWHAFNAQQAHSVENVETTRMIFSPIPKKNITFEEFQIIFEKNIIID